MAWYFVHIVISLSGGHNSAWWVPSGGPVDEESSASESCSSFGWVCGYLSMPLWRILFLGKILEAPLRNPMYVLYLKNWSLFYLRLQFLSFKSTSTTNRGYERDLTSKPLEWIDALHPFGIDFPSTLGINPFSMRKYRPNYFAVCTLILADFPNLALLCPVF